MSFDLNTYYPDVTINGRLVGSLCQFCENSVPSIYKEQGCSWSRFLQPVEGWKATPTTVIHSKKGLLHHSVFMSALNLSKILIS